MALVGAELRTCLKAASEGGDESILKSLGPSAWLNQMTARTAG